MLGLIVSLLLLPPVDNSALQDPPAAADPQVQNTTPENEKTKILPDSRDRIYYASDTERIKPLTTKLFRNILLDQKEIWTSPFHMNRHNAVWWAIFGAGTAALIATDHRTNAYVTRNVRWGNGVSNIGASYMIVPLTAAFYGYGALFDSPRARETGVLGAEAVLDSLIVVTVLKSATQRVRPDATTGERGQFFDRGDSFPSGHTIETWAFASVIAHEYKHKGGRWVPFVAYGLASLVSAARFTADRHYLSDVVAGAGIGYFIGRFVYQTHEDHAEHKHAWTHPRVVPGLDPATRTYSASLLFGN